MARKKKTDAADPGTDAPPAPEPRRAPPLKAALEEHAARLGIATAELVDVEDSPAGIVYTCRDGSRLVDVPADRPDAGGRTGLMFLVAPTENYRGSFPVYEQPLDDDELAAVFNPTVESFDAGYIEQLLDGALDALVEDHVLSGEDEAEIVRAYVLAGGRPPDDDGDQGAGDTAPHPDDSEGGAP